MVHRGHERAEEVEDGKSDVKAKEEDDRGHLPDLEEAVDRHWKEQGAGYGHLRNAGHAHHVIEKKMRKMIVGVEAGAGREHLLDAKSGDGQQQQGIKNSGGP